MDRLGEMEAFVRVVEAGGFTGAAKLINMSKSAVSKHVSSLEARLGTQLLQRTTRKVTLTEIGHAYYEHALRALAAAEEADSLASAMQAVPQGHLRLTTPLSFGLRRLMPAITDYMARYPRVTVELELEDRFADLMAEGQDAAIRIGDLAPSSLRARRIGTADMLLVASPGYLAAAGTPASVEDLAAHELLAYQHGSNVWRLTGPKGEERIVRPGRRLTVNNGDALSQAAERGIGIALLPAFIVGEAVAAGRLVEVLPASRPAPIGIHVLFPPGRYLHPKLRELIDHLAEWMKRADQPEG